MRTTVEAAAARIEQAADDARYAVLTHDEGTPELERALTRANREVAAARLRCEVL